MIPSGAGAGSASGERARATASQLLARPVLTRSDFTFVGAFAVPQEAVGYSTAYASGGFALRHAGGSLHFFATTHVYSGGLVYEMNDPGLSKTNPPSARVVRPWGNIYKGHKCLPKSQGGCGLSSGNWTEGMYYDQTLARLYWSYGYWYNVAQSNNAVLGYSTFGASGVAGYGPWKTSNANGPPSQMVRGGTLRIPDWFAAAYTGGRTLGIGFGGYYSGVASASNGPALFATTDPSRTGSPLPTTALLAYPGNHLAWRDTRYKDEITHHNPKNGHGFWTWADTVEGAGIWLDLPTKQGVLFFPTLGTGFICYKCVSGCGGICTAGYEGSWYIYDPKDLARVAQGHKQSWQIEPVSYFRVKYPLGGKRVTGVAFDSTTQMLYLYVYAAYNCSQSSGCYPLVYAYHVNG